jgi:hypothetical protein
MPRACPALTATSLNRSGRLKNGLLASLIAWLVAMLSFGLVQLILSPEFQGYRPAGLEGRVRLWLFYCEIGALLSLVLIPPLAVLFCFWKPDRWKGRWSQVALVSAGWALVLAVALMAFLASSAADVRELLPALFLICWAATLAGAACLRRLN